MKNTTSQQSESKKECDLKENRGRGKRSVDLATNGNMALLIPGKGISKSSSERREKLKRGLGGFHHSSAKTQTLHIPPADNIVYGDSLPSITL